MTHRQSAISLHGRIELLRPVTFHYLKDAVLINNSSVLAFLPLATNALYSATKAAIHSYTLSQRFLLRDTGVQVIEISPLW